MPKLELTRETPQAYGTQVNDNDKTLRERLMDLFTPRDFVTVINIDDEAFIWQYLPADSEDVEYTPDPMKITHRKDPEVWVLEPGQSETIVGESAYIMIDNLYKKLVAKKKIQATPNQEPTQARAFNYADGGQQETWINRIFLGIATPTFAKQKALSDAPEKTTNRS